MADRLTWQAEWAQRPVVRRVHVRRDSEGRWFWYHYLCRGAHASIETYADALQQAFAHAAQPTCSKPDKSFYGHIEVNCDENSLRASWLCVGCKQYCASHNPCDCCYD